MELFKGDVLVPQGSYSYVLRVDQVSEGVDWCHGKLHVSCTRFDRLADDGRPEGNPGHTHIEVGEVINGEFIGEHSFCDERLLHFVIYPGKAVRQMELFQV